MQTQPMYAYEIDENDFILLNGESHSVKAVYDEGDSLVFVLKNEDEEVIEEPFGPFDTISMVTNFYDEDVEVEDVPIEG